MGFVFTKVRSSLDLVLPLQAQNRTLMALFLRPLAENKLV